MRTPRQLAIRASIATLLLIGSVVFWGSLLLPLPLPPTQPGLLQAWCHAGRATLGACLGVAIFSTVVGTALGLLNLGEGGPGRTLVRGLTDLATSLPTLVTVALLVGTAGRNPFWGFVAGVGSLRALEIAHQFSSTLSNLKPEGAAQEARSRKLGVWAYTQRYLLPQASVPVLTSVALSLPAVVGMEAWLGFLKMPSGSSLSWGQMLVAPDALVRLLGALSVAVTAGAVFVGLRSLASGDRRAASHPSREPGLAAGKERSR